MKWDDVAIGDLRRYPGLCNSVENLAERVRILEESAADVKGANLDRIPISGGGSHYEDKILSNLVEKEKKRNLLKVNKQLKAAIEAGLDALTKEERTVLESFYMFPHKNKNAADSLVAVLYCDRATVYRIRKRALYRFTINMYGIIDY